MANHNYSDDFKDLSLEELKAMALADFRVDGGYRRVSDKYGVPVSTLQNWVDPTRRKDRAKRAKFKAEQPAAASQFVAAYPEGSSPVDRFIMALIQGGITMGESLQDPSFVKTNPLGAVAIYEALCKRAERIAIAIRGDGNETAQSDDASGGGDVQHGGTDEASSPDQRTAG